MLPERIEMAKAHWVHEEFLKYADVFRKAFPELQTLQIDQGTFNLKTADLFNQVRDLRIRA